MSDHIDRAAEVLARWHMGMTTKTAMLRQAQMLHDAGLLATPEHDAAVAAEALRRAADALNAEDSNEWADEADREAVRIIELIRDRADLIEREGGAS